MLFQALAHAVISEFTVPYPIKSKKKEIGLCETQIVMYFAQGLFSLRLTLEDKRSRITHNTKVRGVIRNYQTNQITKHLEFLCI